MKTVDSEGLTGGSEVMVKTETSATVGEGILFRQAVSSHCAVLSRSRDNAFGETGTACFQLTARIHCTILMLLTY